MNKISFLNGIFLPHENCLVSIEDRGFQFADGAYEVTLFENNKLIDGENHVLRLFRSLKELNISHEFSLEYLINIQIELFKKNNIISSHTCYLQITRGTHNRIPNCPKNIKPTICAIISPRKIFTEQEFSAGIKVMTHDDIRWQRCDIKTVNLLASTLINQKAKDSNFDDAIYVRDSIITEATYANIFIIDDKNNLITHPADNNILCGITRNKLITIAKSLNIEVREKKFTIDELMLAKEVFLTSSSLIIRPVRQINHKIIKDFYDDNSIAYILKKHYQKFIDQN
jgi:D-alanine transaminase